MYELIKINENDYYIDCPAKIGVVKADGNNIFLIDSGSDKDTAKKVLKIIGEKLWNLKAVLCTHSHADHIGGCHLLQERTNCSVYAKGLDCVFSNNPVLEPALLYGASPFNELKNKFLMAEKSLVSDISLASLPDGMTIMNLPGHSPDMTGFITKDKTAFIGDTLSSEQTLEKYGIAYFYDIENSIQTLESLKTAKDEYGIKTFVPAHAPVSDEISELIQLNINAINKVMDNILDICRNGRTFEEILKELFDRYALTLNAQQYVLAGSTVRSYLSYLKNSNKLTYTFEDNKMVFSISR